MRFLFAACMIAVGVGACSLFTDLDGLADKEKILVVPEGGTASPDASDSSSGDNLDAATSADASGESGSAVRFCAQANHFFCTDFEESTDNLTEFTDTVVTGGTLKVASDKAKGGTKSLHATQEARTADTNLLNFAYRDMQMKFRRMVVELDILIEAQQWQAGQKANGVFVMGFESSAREDYIFIAPTDTQLAFTGFFRLDTPRIKYDAWVHIKMDCDPLGGKFSAEIDGVPYGPISFPPLPEGNAPNMAIAPGIHAYDAPMPDHSVYYDNITIDFPN